MILLQTLLKFASDGDFLLPSDATNLALDHTKDLPSYSKSPKFQWLPAEFCIDESGGVKITSYINNLHPDHHSELYKCIEKIFEKFVPMFNKVLTGLRNPLKNRIVFNYNDTFEYEMRNEDDEDYDEPPRIRYPLKIPTFEPPPIPEKIVNLKGRNVQVIVKLANIHLTPDQPEYPGKYIPIVLYRQFNLIEKFRNFRRFMAHRRNGQRKNRGIGNLLLFFG